MSAFEFYPAGANAWNYDDWIVAVTKQLSIKKTAEDKEGGVCE